MCCWHVRVQSDTSNGEDCSPAIAALGSCMLIVCWLSNDNLGDFRWQSHCREVPNKIGATILRVDLRLGALSLLLVAAAGVDELVSIVVLYMVSANTNCGNYGCVCQQGTNQGFHSILCKCSSNYTKRGKDIQIKVWPTQKKGIYMLYIWVRFAWCILTTFGIQATNKQIYFWF